RGHRRRKSRQYRIPRTTRLLARRYNQTRRIQVRPLARSRVLSVDSRDTPGTNRRLTTSGWLKAPNGRLDARAGPLCVSGRNLTEHRTPTHDATLRERIIGRGAMHQAAVVPDDQFA